MTPIIHLAISDQISGWYAETGPILFYIVVWGLVFAGTGLFVGAFIPFITGDSLVFAAGLVAAGAAGTNAVGGEVNIWVMAIGVGVFAWLGDQVGYTLGRHYGRPYLDKRQGAWLHSAISKSEKFYTRWGWWAVVISRFMPWARVFVPAIAGIAKIAALVVSLVMEPIVFAALFCLLVLLSILQAFTVRHDSKGAPLA